MSWAFDHFLSWLYIRGLWGPRCPDYEPECYCCQHWLEHDEIFNDSPAHLAKDQE